MKFVTFNIRYDCGEDGINNFSNRKPLILKKIAEENPDIICFQEVLPHVAAWLKESLTDYYVIGCPRSETLEDEQVAIAYKKDRLNLMKMDSYWLSQTPYVPGSRYPEQSICPRICNEVVMQDQTTGQVFRVVNTHLDHIGTAARSRGLEQILKVLDEEVFFPQAPVIVTGDFNAAADSEELKIIRQAPGFADATADVGVTYHGYGKAECQEQIDYIFIKGGITCESVEKWTDVQDGIYLSDHYPICAVLTFL